MKNIFYSMFCFIGLLASLMFLHKFNKMAPTMYSLGEYFGYYFFPVLPTLLFIFLYYKVYKSQNKEEKDLKTNEEISKKTDEEKSKLIFPKNQKEEVNKFNVEEKLDEVETMFKKKIISSKEREKMREKILGINE